MHVSITCFLYFVILQLPSSLCSLLSLCILVLRLSSCFPLPRLFLKNESTQTARVLGTFFWTETSLCVFPGAASLFFLFASICGEPELSSLISLQEPNRLSDPSVTRTRKHTHTYVHGLTSAEFQYAATELRACRERDKRTVVVYCESPSLIVTIPLPSMCLWVSIRATVGTVKGSTLGFC